MAYSTCNTSALRNAILDMWRPTVGSRSMYALIDGYMDKINYSYGESFLDLAMMTDNHPVRPILPCSEDYSDKQPPFQFDKEMLSGSWREGLYFYGQSNIKIPDMDYMFVLKSISFTEEDQLSGKLTLRQETPFVHAYITDEDDLKMWNDFLADDREEDEKGRRLSSRKLKERLYQNHKKSISTFGNNNSNDVDEGAAMCIDRIAYHNPVLKAITNALTNKCPSAMADLTSEIADYLSQKMTFTGWDIVLAISCENWPSCAIEWTTRDRRWPLDDLVQKITHDGFHIVPKSSTEGDFRLSFSYAEATLIENLTELQHKVLRSFKAVVKYHQNSWSPNIEEIITTYHLKTIAFWHFEKETQDSFTESTVVTNLILLLQELAQALRMRELPMYFMPKVNLFEDVENPEETIDIAEKIEQLSQNFPLLIKALDNITHGLARPFGLAHNIVEKCIHLSYRLQRKKN